MRIVIDLEAAQSPHSRNRGIGRYSMALAKAMLRHGGKHEFIVALNGMYADTVVPVREALAGLLPARNIVSWQATQPPLVAHNAGERRAFEVVREAFLASLKADVVHVASLFESGPHSFTSIGLGEAPHRTAVTLYDLIPHVYSDIYLWHEQAAREYSEKIQHLKRADLWLAISEASRREGIERLDLPGERVVNISSAADEHFTPAAVSAEAEVGLRVRYGLWRPFVMYTGGIDHRKNIEGLIEAWAQLPHELRSRHQLAIVCSVQPAERERLEQLAAASGLANGELVLTGFVSEQDLLDLYRTCKLFVFPSLHEGFGLPALEAMRCGAPVIGADNSSIPEVIGRADALFNARSRASITAKLQQCLVDEPFRLELARNGPEQAQQFSWDTSAKTALAAIETLGPPARRAAPASPRRKRLAYVSPLPPSRSGIADYSAELLPALAAHYDIDAIVEQPEQLEALPPGSVRSKRSAEWFMEHGDEYDRILYHFGNSEFHVHMVPLLERYPGTVVLHDFFLSGMQSYRELVIAKEPNWSQALYASHGWPALLRRACGADIHNVIHEFPANFEVLRGAQGVIVHSPFSRQLAGEWYGPGAADGWSLIPHLRVALPVRREEARAQLGLEADDFLVCSFGILAETKMNHRLLAAWQRSSLARDPRCRLVFVGENHPGDYGRELLRSIEAGPGRVSITGWASPEDFRRYLNASDLAVQLRTLSRGETSGTVLDAMNHGVPVIANANGAMAYLPRDAALVLDEEFTDEQLVQALEKLRSDREVRTALGRAARRIIETQHSPTDCATAYAQAIERFAAQAAHSPAALVRQVAAVLPADTDDAVTGNLASGIALSLPQPRPARQLLVDVGTWVRAAGDSASELPALLLGMIEHPLPGWRAEPVYQAADGEWRYAHEFMLRHYGCQLRIAGDETIEIGSSDLWGWFGPREGETTLPLPAVREGLDTVSLPAEGEPEFIWAWLAVVRPSRRGPRLFLDISELVRHDWQGGIQRVVKNYLMELLRRPLAGHTVIPVYATPREHGYRVAMAFLCEAAGLPVDDEQPGDWIRPRAGDTFFAMDLQPHLITKHESYLDELQRQGVRTAFLVYDLLPVRLPDCFLPGAAEHHERWLRVVAKSDLAICISESIADELRHWLKEHWGDDARRRQPEVRAVHLGSDISDRIATRGQPTGAPELLARIRQHTSFLMVGTIEPRKAYAAVLAAFETLWEEGHDTMLVIVGRPGWMVDELQARLRSHPERGQRLVWVEDASDEFLEALYESSTALIAASRGEGFGLPLVEAAQRGLPIIARDLPVFREVAGTHAHYFRDDGALALSASLATWMELAREDRHPKPEGLPRLTWEASAAQVKRVLLETAQSGANAAPRAASADVGHAGLHDAEQQGLVLG
ncbi:hypothetical protein GCM10027034_20950 [Ramlibacter solisilvae]|uniref:glycosyltransferase n=1 Tax=Ramlibacter tataouinensis TaxID=94132 RepID=UPI0007779B7C|nr:glycosyltransferase [Ramlibacter tataouinensis]